MKIRDELKVQVVIVHSKLGTLRLLCGKFKRRKRRSNTLMSSLLKTAEGGALQPVGGQSGVESSPLFCSSQTRRQEVT